MARRVVRWLTITLLLLIAASSAFIALIARDAAAATRTHQAKMEKELATLTTEFRGTREFLKVVEAEARKPAKWEYRLETPHDLLFDDMMAEYGSQGWELVAARRATGSGGVAYEMIFKRRKP